MALSRVKPCLNLNCFNLQDKLCCTVGCLEVRISDKGGICGSYGPRSAEVIQLMDFCENVHVQLCRLQYVILAYLWFTEAMLG